MSEECPHYTSYVDPCHNSGIILEYDQLKLCLLKLPACPNYATSCCHLKTSVYMLHENVNINLK